MTTSVSAGTGSVANRSFIRESITRRTRAAAVHLLAVAIAFALPAPVRAQAGYGYARGKDPLIIGLKKVILSARNGEWDAVAHEVDALAWQFEELRTDLRVELEKGFRAAVAKRSTSDLALEVGSLTYFSIVQKFHWNHKEELSNYVRSKSRVDAARSYYEEILAIGVRNRDRLTKTDYHEETLAAFDKLRKSLGSPGLFGINARSPSVDDFKAGERAVLARLRRVYPQVKEIEEKAKKLADEEKEESSPAPNPPGAKRSPESDS